MRTALPRQRLVPRPDSRGPATTGDCPARRRTEPGRERGTPEVNGAGAGAGFSSLLVGVLLQCLPTGGTPVRPAGGKTTAPAGNGKRSRGSCRRPDMWQTAVEPLASGAGGGVAGEIQRKVGTAPPRPGSAAVNTPAAVVRVSEFGRPRRIEPDSRRAADRSPDGDRQARPARPNPGRLELDVMANYPERDKHQEGSWPAVRGGKVAVQQGGAAFTPARGDLVGTGLPGSIRREGPGLPGVDTSPRGSEERVGRYHGPADKMVGRVATASPGQAARPESVGSGERLPVAELATRPEDAGCRLPETHVPVRVMALSPPAAVAPGTVSVPPPVTVPTGVASGWLGNFVEEAAGWVAHAVRAGASERVVMKLSPPELGLVEVRLEKHRQGLALRLDCSELGALQRIQDSLGLLVQRLAQLGVSTAGVELFYRPRKHPRRQPGEAPGADPVTGASISAGLRAGVRQGQHAGAVDLVA